MKGKEKKMSHYRVAVFQTPESPDVDELMAPYSEHIEVEPYVDMPREEALARAREQVTISKVRVGSDNENKWDKSYAAHFDDDDDHLLKWYAATCGWELDEDGNILTTYNPKSKWDYYGEIETLAFDEWLTSGTDASEEELRRDWKILSTRGDWFYNKEYYLVTYGDEDSFVKDCQLPAGWAVVTPDGEWHEPGKVGWFGVDDSTEESRRDWRDHFHERFVEPYDPKSTTVVILDCHI